MSKRTQFRKGYDSRRGEHRLRMIPHDAKSPPVRSSPSESIRWVAANISRAEVRFEDAPTTEAYGLLQAVRQSRGHRWEFWTKMWAVVSRGEGRGKSARLTATDEADEEEGVGGQDEGIEGTIAELLERYGVKRGQPNPYVPPPGAKAGSVLPGGARIPKDDASGSED